jgi:peptidoglycan-associated lipoprotein
MQRQRVVLRATTKIGRTRLEDDRGSRDERGSEEYNHAHGERRATAVKQYLVDSGVSGATLDTVSFGEAKAAVQGHDESAWKWNRRAEFVVRR